MTQPGVPVHSVSLPAPGPDAAAAGTGKPLLSPRRAWSPMELGRGASCPGRAHAVSPTSSRAPAARQRDSGTAGQMDW